MLARVLVQGAMRPGGVPRTVITHTRYLQVLSCQVADELNLVFECERYRNLRTGHTLEVLEVGFDWSFFRTLEPSGDLRVEEGVVEEPPAQQPRQADG